MAEWPSKETVLLEEIAKALIEFRDAGGDPFYVAYAINSLIEFHIDRAEKDRKEKEHS